MSTPAACPDCGEDLDLAAPGWCAGCGKWTGLCDAGRELWYPAWLGEGLWHIPCPLRWVAPWHLWPPAPRDRARFCTGHGTAVSLGQAPVRGVVLGGTSGPLPQAAPVGGGAPA